MSGDKIPGDSQSISQRRLVRKPLKGSVVRTYSHSQLQTFETCPLRYKFRYIDRLEAPIEETVEMYVGSRVHETLEKLYKDLQLEKLNSLDELLEFYHAEWKKQWNAAVKITRQGYSEKNYADYGAKCVRQYYERHKPFNESETLDVERWVSFSLSPSGKYRMRGKIDRVARRRDGDWEIIDYKTGGHVYTQAEADRDRQLALYQIGLETLWPEVKRVELVWHFVGRNMTVRSSRARERLDELRDATIQLINRIEAEKAFEPCRGSWCDWCEYQPVCPLWKHVVATQALPPAQFAADEGVQLANQIAEAKRQRDTWDQRYEALRELIAEFCRQQKIRAVAGSGVRVSVKETEQIKLPGKNDAERENLERLLKKLGRWEYVAGLDIYELKRVMKDRLWPEDVLAQLQPYATTETATQVRVTRTKESDDEEL